MVVLKKYGLAQGIASMFRLERNGVVMLIRSYPKLMLVSATFIVLGMAVADAACSRVSNSSERGVAMTAGEESPNVTQQKWRIAHVLKHDSGVSALALHPDGSEVASGSILNATVYIWDVNTGNQIRVLKGLKGGVQALAYSPDGQFLAVGRGLVPSNTISVHVFRTDTGTLVQQLEPPRIVTRDAPTGVVDVKSLQYSPNGQFLAVGFRAGAIGIYGVKTGSLMHSFSTPGALHGPISYSQNEQFVAVSERVRTEEDVFAHNVIHLLDGTSGRVVKTFSGHADLVTSLAFSPDDKYLVSGSNTGGVRGELDRKKNQGVELRNEDPIRIWDVQRGAIVRELVGHTGTVASLLFSDSGRALISGSHDKTIKMWNVGTGALAWTLTGHDGPVSSIAVSADSHHLLSGGGANLTIWESQP